MCFIWFHASLLLLSSAPSASPEDTSAKAPLMSALGGDAAEPSLVMSASAGNVLLAEQMRSLKAHPWRNRCVVHVGKCHESCGGFKDIDLIIKILKLCTPGLYTSVLYYLV